jgi:hypothetical protein
MTFAYEPLEGGPALEDVFGGIVDRATDMTPAFAAIVESFHALEQVRFDQNGPGWAPLADSTISMTGSWARSNTNFDQILRDTGALLASLEGGVGGYSLMTPFSVEIGTTISYAHWHQTGGTKPGRPPQRKIVDLDETAALEWAGILGEWIFEGVVK